MCTVSTKDAVKLLTIRSTNFERAAAGDSQDLPTESVDCDQILSEQKGKFVENIVAKSEMADLTTAKYVVSGGRALKSGENF